MYVAKQSKIGNEDSVYVAKQSKIGNEDSVYVAKQNKIGNEDRASLATLQTKIVRAGTESLLHRK